MLKPFQIQATTQKLWILISTSLASLFLSLVLMYDLEWETHVSIRRGLFLFLFGIVFFTTLFKTINLLFLFTVTGQKIIKSYKLTKSDVFDISNKQVSAVQALFCCITGITCILYSCNRDMLKTSHYISEAYGWFGAAYFLYDIWSMYEVFCAKPTGTHTTFGNNVINYFKENAMIIGHHIFIGGFGFLVITYLRGGLGDCFFGFVYLMEASTPFVSMRGILSKLGAKSSSMYVINGLLMLIIFFMCRVAMFPYVLHMYAVSVNKDFLSAVISLPKGCLISIVILLIPQIYWFVLMLTGATKLLRHG